MLTGTTDPEAVTLATGFDPGKLITFTRGEKIFELSNHLGNSLSRTCGILVTISDRKILVKTGSGSESNGGCDAGTAAEELTLTERGTATSMVAKNRIRLLPGFSSGSGDSFTAYIDNSRPGCELADNPTANPDQYYYIADVISANDYYPFGMQMPGRKYSQNSTYRYGFNGKENDNEVKGEGSQQDYGMRIYDPRLGRFLSVDPLTTKYPWYTPYHFAGNKPIWAVDLDGLEDVIYTNSILMDEKFGKAQTLMVSTDMGLKAVTDVWDTEKKTIKQDVYFVLVDDPSFFDGEENHAFTITFNSKALSDGKYIGQYKEGDANVRLQYSDDKIVPALQQIDFSITTNKKLKDGNVSVIFVNKVSSDKLSTVDYSNTIYHELKAHVVRNIDLPATSPDRSGDKDHEEYHGTRGRYSPRPGNEKKGSIMNRYLDQAKKSYFNPDKKDNIYKPEPQKPTPVKKQSSQVKREANAKQVNFYFPADNTAFIVS